MSAARVPHTRERIEEASRWVDVALREMDREADLFHQAQDRERQVLESFLLRLQVLSIPSGDPERSADEDRFFEAAFRDAVRAAKDTYDRSRARTSSGK